MSGLAISRRAVPPPSLACSVGAKTFSPRGLGTSGYDCMTHRLRHAGRKNQLSWRMMYVRHDLKRSECEDPISGPVCRRRALSCRDSLDDSVVVFGSPAGKALVMKEFISTREGQKTARNSEYIAILHTVHDVSENVVSTLHL